MIRVVVDDELWWRRDVLCHWRVMWHVNQLVMMCFIVGRRSRRCCQLASASDIRRRSVTSCELPGRYDSVCRRVTAAVYSVYRAVWRTTPGRWDDGGVGWSREPVGGGWRRHVRPLSAGDRAHIHWRWRLMLAVQALWSRDVIAWTSGPRLVTVVVSGRRCEQRRARVERKTIVRHSDVALNHCTYSKPSPSTVTTRQSSYWQPARCLRISCTITLRYLLYDNIIGKFHQHSSDKSQRTNRQTLTQQTTNPK